jgi:hypothetical protein
MAIVGVRDFLEKRGHKVDWDNDRKEISVDGSVISRAPFTLEGERHYGTPTDILNAIGEGGYKSPYATTVDPDLTSKLNAGLNSGLISQNEYKGLNAMLFNEADAKNPYSVNQILTQLANRQPYQSQYDTQISGIMNKISQPFAYDPSTDPNLYNAQQQVMERMNERGILNSSMTGEEALRLVPQFQQQAYNQYADQQNSLLRQAEFYRMLDNEGYNRYMDEADSLYKRANFINSLDEQAYQRYRDGVTQDYNDRMFAHNQKIQQAETARQQISDAWERTNNLGYVDNQSSILLGVPVGTPSKSAREAAIKREQEIEDMLYEVQAQAERDERLFGQEFALIQERENSAIRQTQAQGQKEIDVFNYKNAAQGQQNDRINQLFTLMMQNPNPDKWLEHAAGGGLTLEEYKTLKGMLPEASKPTQRTFKTSDYSKRVGDMLSDATVDPEERKYNAIDYLYNLEINGQLSENEADEIYYFYNITEADMRAYAKAKRKKMQLEKTQEDVQNKNLPGAKDIMDSVMNKVGL